jgi:membrane protein DedA with SNARE-associated domain
MNEIADQGLLTVGLFALIFALNLIPAFAPPTWVTLSFIGLTVPAVDVVPLALIGASAATLGRVTLCKLARWIVRQRILSVSARRNVDAIKDALEKRAVLAFSVFLAFAFSPLPSNYLFIAYGLTSLRLSLVALPFFVGRFISYGFWISTSSAVGDRLHLDSLESGSYLGLYFIMSQLLLVPTMYCFTKIDWRALIEERRIRWLREARPDDVG